MKILYVISNSQHGQGGHYYSCSTIATGYHKLNSLGDAVSICIIGTNNSPVIQSSPLNKFYIDVHKNGFLKSLEIFINIVKKGKYDILHAFDPRAFAFVRITSLLLKKKNILTKCGGPNRINWPYSSNLIVFSKENNDFYKNNSKYKNSNLFLLPNRVVEEFENNINVMDEREKLGLKGAKVILRIARINEWYAESSLNILEKFIVLNKELPNLKLLFIGVIESEEAYKKLCKSIYEINEFYQKEVVLVKTTDNYTVNASRYIDLADFVIATGRGAIEAMAKSKPVFIVTKNKKIVLITEKTVPEISYYNFSGRISKTITPYFDKYSIENIMDTLINRDDYMKKVEEFSLNWYRKYLSLEYAIKDYEKMYQFVKRHHSKIKPLDLLINLAVAYKSFKKFKIDIHQNKDNS